MMDFLKTCGLGLLYLLLSPFILAFFAIYAVYSTAVFIIMFFKATLLFFKGKSIFDPTEEEIEAHKIIEARKTVVTPNQPSPQYINPNPGLYQQPYPYPYPYPNQLPPQYQQPTQIQQPPINVIEMDVKDGDGND